MPPSKRILPARLLRNSRAFLIRRKRKAQELKAKRALFAKTRRTLAEKASRNWLAFSMRHERKARDYYSKHLKALRTKANAGIAESSRLKNEAKKQEKEMSRLVGQEDYIGAFGPASKVDRLPKKARKLRVKARRAANEAENLQALLNMQKPKLAALRNEVKRRSHKTML